MSDSTDIDLAFIGRRALVVINAVERAPHGAADDSTGVLRASEVRIRHCVQFHTKILSFGEIRSVNHEIFFANLPRPKIPK